jgi:hypothetical protein
MNHRSRRLISAPFYTIAQPFSTTKSNYLTPGGFSRPRLQIQT